MLRHLLALPSNLSVGPGLRVVEIARRAEGGAEGVGGEHMDLQRLWSLGGCMHLHTHAFVVLSILYG